MTVFADSSALVKLYVDEVGADEIRHVASMAVASLARVEVPAALWRKVRVGVLEPEQARLLVADFESDWYGEDVSTQPRFASVIAGPQLLEAAARLVAVHRLRAYDGVQLASAMAARTVDPGVDVLACFDVELRAAGSAEGFALLPT